MMLKICDSRKEIVMTREEIYDLIDEEGVEFIRLQFTDLWGNLKNIAITPGQMDRVLNYMYSFDGSALFDERYRLNDELCLYPDLDTFVILPWRPQQGKVAKMICDVYNMDGSICEYSPRTVLKNTIEAAKKEGYTFKINPENEFFLFHTDEAGNPTTLSHEKAGYLDVGPADFGENARRDMVLTLEDMGFEVESSHHEKAPAQHEIDFTQGESLEIADSIVTFRFAVKSIAKRFGLCATFMPKPKSDVAGSGMHLNFAVYKDGKPIFSEKNGEISEDAKYFIGGILAHAEGMSAVTNPIVNSYKRILNGCEAPQFVNWTKRGEHSLVKYHERFGEKKVEVRIPDSAANPYLAIAVCIAAGLDGIKNKIAPTSANVSKKTLPCNLKDAIRHFRKDEVVKGVLGEDLAKIYIGAKEQEWTDYMKQVSDWEVERYLLKM